MADTSILINIGSQTASAIRGITGVNKALGEQMSIAQKAGSTIKKSLAPATAVMAGMGAAAMVVVNAASDQQQAFGALDSVYKANSESMKVWAKNQSAIGLSASEAANAASLLGAQLKNAGASTAEAATKSQKLVGLGADLAATFGGSTADAVSAVSAALKGEFDSLEKYGVSLSASKVEQQAMAMGLAKTSKELTAQDKALATQTLLWQQTADAQGQAQRESDSYAGTMAALKAQFTNLAATLGTALLPVMTKVGEAFKTFATWASENQGTVQVIAVVVGGLAAAIITLNVAMSAWAAVTAVWSAITAVATVVGGAFSAVVLALTAPITLIILAIVAFIAIVVLLWKNWDTVTKALGVAWDWLKAKAIAVFNALKAFFTSVWNSVKAVFVSVWNGIKSFLIGIWNGIKAAIGTYIGAWKAVISTILNTIKGIFTSAWEGIKKGVNSAFGRIKEAVSGGISGVLKLIRELPGDIVSAIGDLGSLLFDKGKDLIQGLIDGIKSMAGRAASAIGDFLNPFNNSVPATSMAFAAPTGSTYAAPRVGVQNVYATFNLTGTPAENVREFDRYLRRAGNRQAVSVTA